MRSVVRRALAVSAAAQYLRIAIRLASMALVVRLLTPSEVGVAVIGTAIMTIALGLREFASSEFLIQRHEIGRDDIRTSFTLVFVMTALMTAAIFVVAPWVGGLYGEEKLASFLRITAVAGLIEAVSLPILALLRRDMAFGAVASIQTASATVTAVATAWLAFAGFSYMSYAWAAVAAAAASTALAFYFRPDLSILRPAFKSWANVLTFGGYNGASFVINRIYESLPSLVLGYLLPHAAVGLYNRASVVSDIPDKVVLTSVFSVAFPALAAEVRAGRSLKEPYLRSLGFITVFYWPAQVLLALLAYPVVMLFLGPQWLERRGSAAAAHGDRRAGMVPGDADVARAPGGRRQSGPRAGGSGRPLAVRGGAVLRRLFRHSGDGGEQAGDAALSDVPCRFTSCGGTFPSAGGRSALRCGRAPP